MHLFPTETRPIELRDYQVMSVEKLREGIRAGARRQVLVAPTGYGKTECAAHIIYQAQQKGSTAWFVVDRLALVDQTSDRFGGYGIDHGIIQADNILTDYRKPVQIVSAQTLERRDLSRTPLPDLIILDECHAQRKAILNLIDEAERTRTIGLTATPFAAGMAKHWDGVVNGATVNQLLEKGYLTPLRIKACVAPDMVGAKKTFTGEYDEEDAGQRGITIIGNVVETWIKQTRAHFGGPVKTIVFSPSVAHGAELCRLFAEAGFNFQQISYLDGGTDDRRAKIAEFRRPDSTIQGLVSCEVLTKGFDVSDVLCGISCRPYRKSFSSHIQEMGRVMRIHPGKKFALWLDHSSNVIRFADDAAWLFEHGVDSLSDAAKRDSTPREATDAVRKKHFCPECGTQVVMGVCPSCGWERPRLGTIEVVQGELIDFEISTRHAFQPRPGLRAECLGRAQAPLNIWNAAVAYCEAHTRKGPDAARKWAFGIWKGVFPGAKLPRGLYDAPSDPDRVQVDEWSLIEREINRFRKTAGRPA